MQCWPQAPRAERMEECRSRVARLIGVVFVPQLTPIVVGPHQVRELGAEGFDLPFSEQANAADVAVRLERRDLLIAEQREWRVAEEARDRAVLEREVGRHDENAQKVVETS